MRFPTVVNCAGWKCVKPRVGKSRYCFANLAKRSMTTASFWMRRSSPWRMKMRSALLRRGEGWGQGSKDLAYSVT